MKDYETVTLPGSGAVTKTHVVAGPSDVDGHAIYVGLERHDPDDRASWRAHLEEHQAALLVVGLAMCLSAEMIRRLVMTLQQQVEE